MKPFRYVPALLLLITCMAVWMSSCKVGRFVVYNVADIRDYKKFPHHDLHRPATTFYFQQSEQGKAPKSVTDETTGRSLSFDEYLEKNHTVAFLIIQHDTIRYEKYFEGYDQGSIVPSFSMAKSFTSILIGCAIDDGLIGSVNDSITQYIPELSKHGFGQVTIAHLLQMTSGLKFNEGYYNPFGQVATFYYGTNLRRAIRHLRLKHAPGTRFEYVSGGTQLLGLVLERALKGKTITQYMEEKLWLPLGMQYDASWSTDRKKEGLEKTFCCVNATAIDFAKIGRLYLHKGNWNGQQIVPEEWISQSTKVDSSGGSAWYYQYQWWLPTPSGDFLANGYLGQYIYVNPVKDLIIVRLGKKPGRVKWGGVFVSLAEIY